MSDTALHYIRSTRKRTSLICPGGSQAPMWSEAARLRSVFLTSPARFEGAFPLGQTLNHYTNP
eukprot:208932-Chlamydomonas_euryale.AAC.2